MEIFFNELSLEQTLLMNVLITIKNAYTAMKSKNITVCRVSREILEQLKTRLLAIPGISQRTITDFFLLFFSCSV